MKKITQLIKSRKIIWPAVIIIIMLAGGGYFLYQKTTSGEQSVKYVTQKAAKGMLISLISGTGQVSTSNQVDIKPKVSGNITLLNASNGQTVKESQLLAQIDSRAAAVKVKEAQDSLAISKLELDELLAPVDEYTLIQAENTLADAQDSLTKLKMTQANDYQDGLKNKQSAEDNLNKAYEDAYNNIAEAFLDLPDIMTGNYDILFSYGIGESELPFGNKQNNSALLSSFYIVNDYDNAGVFEKYLNIAEKDYQAAKKSYDDNFDDYKKTGRSADREAVKSLLTDTIGTVKAMADSIKSATNLIDFWVEYRSGRNLKIYNVVTSYQADLNSYISQVNSNFSTLLSAQRSIDDYRESIVQTDRSLAEMAQNHPLELAAAERSLLEKEKKLADLKVGATELEIKSKQLSVRQKQNSLTDAQQGYADYFIRAPFDGTVVNVGVARGDSISSATVIASLITNQKIAEVALNEIDAARIKTGQKATLQFDAVGDLSITGEVVEIDAIGTVSQGVVSYNVKIAFDVQDERVKPGMSVSASIIIESKQDVLLAPVGAVKSSGAGSYVEVLVDGQPQRKTVTVGSASDTMIEITGGLEEGGEIITQTINNGASAAASQNTSSGQNGQPGFGGELRMLR